MKAWIAYPLDSESSHRDRLPSSSTLVADLFLESGPVEKQFGVYGLPRSKPAKTFEFKQLLGSISQSASILEAQRYIIPGDIDVLVLEIDFVGTRFDELDKWRRAGAGHVRRLLAQHGLHIEHELVRYAVCLVNDVDVALNAGTTQVHFLELAERSEYVQRHLALRMVGAVAAERQLVDRATLRLRNQKYSPRAAHLTLNKLLSWHQYPPLDNEEVQATYQRMRASLCLDQRSEQIKLNLRTIIETSRAAIVSGIAIAAGGIGIASALSRPWWLPPALIAAFILIGFGYWVSKRR